MNQSPARILAEYLEQEGIFTSPDAGGDWPLYVSHMPETGADCAAAIYDTQGTLVARYLAGENIFQYGIQVRIRSLSYLDGWQKAEEVVCSFESVSQEQIDVDGEVYTIDSISQQGQILANGKDGSTRREVFTVNALAMFLE